MQFDISSQYARPHGFNPHSNPYFVGLVANALYSHCYAVMGPGRAAIFPPLVPVLGTLLAAAVLGEALNPTQIAGMALVVGGMLLAGLWRRPAFAT